MTQYLNILGRRSPFLIALVAAIALGVYFSPYLAARICWDNKSWTSNVDFIVALFEAEHPGILADVVVERDDTGLLRAGNGGVFTQATPPTLNYPSLRIRGDRYSGLVSMEVPGPTGLRVVFLDSCGKFIGAVQ